MKSRCSKLLISLGVFLSVLTPAFAEDMQGQIDRSIQVGQKAFDSGNFLKAEHTWQKAQTDFAKSSTPDQKLAKLLQLLGDCYSKEGKFSKADEAYKQSLEVLRGLSLDQSDILAKMKDLEAFYRPINLEGFDDNATAFVKQVGAVCASALNKDEKRHIDISLRERFQEGIKELIEAAPASVMEGKSPEAAAAAAQSLAPKDAPQVKQIRLDKLIAFDVVRSDSDGKLTLANIQGISLNVGLWVKVKEFAMAVNEQNSPIAELTAGAFGVDKKVKVELPQGLFNRLRQGIDKFDPFLVIASQAGANSGGTPGSANVAAPPASTVSTAPAASTPPSATDASSAATSAAASAAASPAVAPASASNTNAAAVSDNNAPITPSSGATETSVVK
jgi:tetratricopeptide (TPR) repeat protein